MAQHPEDFRAQAWKNLGQLMDNAGATVRLPRKVRGIIASVRR